MQVSRLSQVSTRRRHQPREPGHEVIVDNSPGVLSEGKAVVSVRTQPSHEPDHEPDRGPDHEPEYE